MQWEDSAVRCMTAVALACYPVALFFYYLPGMGHGQSLLFIQMVLTWIFTFIWQRLYLDYILSSNVQKKQKVLIVGAGRSGHFFYEWLEKNHSAPYKVVGFLDDDPEKLGRSMSEATVLGPTNQILEIGRREGVNTAIIGISQKKSAELIMNILTAKLKGWNIQNVVDEYEEITGRVPVEYIQNEWLLFADGFYLLRKPVMQKVKRFIDICFSISFLVLFPPLFLITALAVYLDSPGPIIFRQVRVGKGGKHFELLKFRSMYLNAEENGAVWAQKKDLRITRVGRLIRFLRIDEFPQMVNILRGDMSLIGPRPERPEFINRLNNKISYYSLRHCIKPGITGWAQVQYPYGASVEDALNKHEYDLYYIKNLTLFMDLKILLKTFGVMIFGQGSR